MHTISSRWTMNRSPPRPLVDCAPPAAPRIYHIVHVDRLAPIIADGALWCDAEVKRRRSPGTTIGMSEVKRRRLGNPLPSYPDLHVGDCVPFYFCPRSVMLYVIHKANHPELQYRGGQGPIVHLEVDLHEAVDWADRHGRRWVFTLSNAGSSYFEDRCCLGRLTDLDWRAIEATEWVRCKEQKQAEFLVEESFPWRLIQRVCVHSLSAQRLACKAVAAADHRPPVEVESEWYYG